MGLSLSRENIFSNSTIKYIFSHLVLVVLESGEEWLVVGASLPSGLEA